MISKLIFSRFNKAHAPVATMSIVDTKFVCDHLAITLHYARIDGICAWLHHLETDDVVVHKEHGDVYILRYFDIIKLADDEI